MINLVKKVKANKKCLMIVAHNPGITMAFFELTNARIDHVPTAGVGMISFDVNDFAQIGSVKGKLEFFTYPKALQ